MLMLILWIKASLLMSICYAARSVTSERSIQDKGFSLKAQRVMQSAMKLPPHILPTLDELDPTTSSLNTVRDRNVGVYVPGKSQPVGIYVPKNGPKGHPKITSRPKPRPKRKTPQPRPQPKPKSKRPMFQINIAPNSPLRKLYEMSKSKSEKVIQNLKKVKLKDHRYIKSKHTRRPPAGPPRRKRHRKKQPPKRGLTNQYQLSANHQHPYKFEEANFALPDMPSMPSIPIMPGIPINVKERQSSMEEMLGLPLPVHEYVPVFVKEALAKSFLKKPERYLQNLYEQQKKRETNPSSPLPQSKSKLNTMTKKQLQQKRRYLKRMQLLDQLLYEQPQPLKANTFVSMDSRHKLTSETELNFDDSFPWEDAVALQKYDTAFKSGAAFGWEKKKKEIEEQAKMKEQQPEPEIQSRIDRIMPVVQSVTKTLCFCCDESKEHQHMKKKEFLKGDLLKHKRKRKRKSITIEDSNQSEQIMLNKEYISDSMKCENQEPVEVVLVFNERKSNPSTSTAATTRRTTTTTSPNLSKQVPREINVPPQLLETFGPNYYNFDPIKVDFASKSTSTPFSKRRSDLVVDERIPSRNHSAARRKLDEMFSSSSMTATTTEAPPVRADESTTSKISSLLKAQSMPHIVDTMPGYNILRLFTGG